MKKKIFLIISITLVIILLGGIVLHAANINFSDIFKFFEKGSAKKGILDEMLEGLSKDISVDNSIKNEYDLDVIVSSLGLSLHDSVSKYISSIPSNLYGVNNWFPIEYIRKTDETHVMVVYKTRDSAGELIYVYLFFERLTFTDEGSQDLENWYREGRAFYSVKTLSYTDFKDIKIGSVISEVQKVDSAVTKYRKTDNSESLEDDIEIQIPKLEQVSYHLLTDGILKISYSDTDSGVVVASMEYSKDFTIINEFTGKSIYRPFTANDLGKINN